MASNQEGEESDRSLNMRAVEAICDSRNVNPGFHFDNVLLDDHMRAGEHHVSPIVPHEEMVSVREEATIFPSQLHQPTICTKTGRTNLERHFQ